jgi:hypothetical protein
VDVSLGQVKNRNDLQFGYAFEREEQDAILASFAESEQRAPTNIVQPRIYALWKLRQNTTASFTMWVGRTLNSNLEHAIVAAGTTPGRVVNIIGCSTLGELAIQGKARVSMTNLEFVASAVSRPGAFAFRMEGTWVDGRLETRTALTSEVIQKRLRPTRAPATTETADHQQKP